MRNVSLAAGAASRFAVYGNIDRLYARGCDPHAGRRGRGGAAETSRSDNAGRRPRSRSVMARCRRASTCARPEPARRAFADDMPQRDLMVSPAIDLR